jgi:hypothetical protein
MRHAYVTSPPPDCQPVTRRAGESGPCHRAAYTKRKRQPRTHQPIYTVNLVLTPGLGTPVTGTHKGRDWLWQLDCVAPGRYHYRRNYPRCKRSQGLKFNVQASVQAEISIHISEADWQSTKPAVVLILISSIVLETILRFSIGIPRGIRRHSAGMPQPGVLLTSRGKRSELKK